MAPQDTLDALTAVCVCAGPTQHSCLTAEFDLEAEVMSEA